MIIQEGLVDNPCLHHQEFCHLQQPRNQLLGNFVAWPCWLRAAAKPFSVSLRQQALSASTTSADFLDFITWQCRWLVSTSDNTKMQLCPLSEVAGQRPAAPAATALFESLCKQACARCLFDLGASVEFSFPLVLSPVPSSSSAGACSAVPVLHETKRCELRRSVLEARASQQAAEKQLEKETWPWPPWRSALKPNLLLTLLMLALALLESPLQQRKKNATRTRVATRRVCASSGKSRSGALSGSVEFEFRHNLSNSVKKVQSWGCLDLL